MLKRSLLLSFFLAAGAVQAEQAAPDLEKGKAVITLTATARCLPTRNWPVRFRNTWPNNSTNSSRPTASLPSASMPS